MADPIGEFSLQLTGAHTEKTDNGVNAHSHWEGTATGYGTVFGTLTVPLSLAETNPTSGTCTWAGQAFLEDGTSLIGVAEGTWQKVEGQHRWTTSMVGENSDGSRLRSEGEIDLASRSYTGKLFEVD